MAKPVDTRAISRPGGYGVFAEPRAVYVEAPRFGADTGKYDGLVRGLSSVSAYFRGKAEEEKKRFDEAERMRAEKDALTLHFDELSEAVAKGHIPPEASPAYSRAFMEYAGRRWAYQRSQEFATDYANNAEGLRQSGGVDEFVAKYMADYGQAMVDPDFTNGALPILRDSAEKLFETHAKFSIEQQRSEARENLYGSLRGTLEDGVKQGLSTEALRAILDGHHMDGRELFGMLPDDLMQMKIQVIQDLAIETGNADLFDVFDVMGAKGSGAPSQSGKWGSVIRDARIAAVAKNEQVRTAVSAADSIAAFTQFSAMAAKGRFGPEQVAAALDAGMSEAKIISLITASTKARGAGAGALNDTRLWQTNPRALSAKKQRQMLNQDYQTLLQAKGQEVALQYAVDMGRRIGKLPDDLQNVLEVGALQSGANSQATIVGYDLYRRLKESNFPLEAMSGLDNYALSLYGAMDTAIGGGIPVEQAAQNAAEYKARIPEVKELLKEVDIAKAIPESLLGNPTARTALTRHLEHQALIGGVTDVDALEKAGKAFLENRYSQDQLTRGIPNTMIPPVMREKPDETRRVLVDVVESMAAADTRLMALAADAALYPEKLRLAANGNTAGTGKAVLLYDSPTGTIPLGTVDMAVVGDLAIERTFGATPEHITHNAQAKLLKAEEFRRNIWMVYQAQSLAMQRRNATAGLLNSPQGSTSQVYRVEPSQDPPENFMNADTDKWIEWAARYANGKKDLPTIIEEIQAESNWRP